MCQGLDIQTFTRMHTEYNIVEAKKNKTRNKYPHPSSRIQKNYINKSTIICRIVEPTVKLYNKRDTGIFNKSSMLGLNVRGW